MSHISDGDREWEGVSETTEMCGISVIISGIRIDLSSLLPDIDSHVTEAQQVSFSMVHSPEFFSRLMLYSPVSSVTIDF